MPALHVTLPGMVFESAGPDGSPVRELFPWSQVRVSTAVPSRVSLYDEQGRLARRDGRTLMSQRCCARRANVALRAQQRWFKRAWERGELSVDEKCRSSGPAAWIALGLSTLLGVVMIVTMGPGFIRLWEEDAALPLPPEARLLPRIIALGTATVYGFLCVVGLAICFRLTRGSRCEALHLDRQGVGVRLRDGQEISASWASLREIAWWHHGLPTLRFRDGVELRLNDLRPRTRLILRVIEKALLPEQVEQRERSQRRALIRAGLWLVGGFAVIAMVASHVGDAVVRERASALEIFAVLLFSGCMMALLLWAVSPHPRLERAWQRRRKRRRRILAARRR